MRVPSGPAGSAYLFFSLPEIFFFKKKADLVSCLLGNLLHGDTCIFRQSQLFLQFRNAHLSGPHYLLGIFENPLAVSSKATRRLRLSSTVTHWLSSSLDEGELCCGFVVFRSSPGTEELSPLLLCSCFSCHSFCQLSCFVAFFP